MTESCHNDFKVMCMHMSIFLLSGREQVFHVLLIFSGIKYGGLQE